MADDARGADADREYRDARRRVARTLHPDRGGDPAAFHAALEEIERTHRGAGRPTPVTSHDVVFVRRRPVRRRVLALMRSAQQRIGRRRYIDL
ncbi:hypothetical protein [Gordonia soli]|uniref:J domain-containing protein n=1 Tax=Gordonia soli NBRC 108243 TaxID=1223545 RepID=M0QFP3_9ACTN|nr:hypothetical protein [Gordonia soli]GAC67136.1 hypothetical protein GS4_05_03500 [Gordonia soli NBRC 108243]